MGLERRRDEIAGEADDRADAQVDVPRQYHQRLADSDDRDDRDVLRDSLPIPDGQEVRGPYTEEDDDSDERDQDADLAQPERSRRELVRLHCPHTRDDHAAASTPAAAWMTRSCVASSRDNSATSCPSRMTRMRSLIPRISGSSDEMRRIVRP